MTMAAPAPISLLCLPCAGASAAPYLAWRRWLPSWVALRPVELPGRGLRLDEPLEPDFDALVSRLCDEHADALAGPHAFFGHSLGALIALAMARRATARGHAPARLLFACASTAPAQRDPRRVAAIADNDVALLAELRAQGGTPPEVLADPDMRRITLDALRADFRACAGFAPERLPGTRPGMPIHVFGGRADRIPANELEDWCLETTGEFALDWFDGGHFFLREHTQALATRIAARLGADGAPSSVVPHALPVVADNGIGDPSRPNATALARSCEEPLR